MEQNIQENRKETEIKLDGEGDPIDPNAKRGSKIKIILFVFIIIAVLAGAGVYCFVLNKKNDAGPKEEEKTEVMKDEEERVAEIDKTLDTDQDKLPDYLEEIIGTDKNSADTDGDSYNDLVEIQNGYDPLTNEKYTTEKLNEEMEKIKAEDEELYKKEFGSAFESAEFNCGIDTVYDIDGNIYNTVKIYSQCWLKENLKVTKNPAGEAITRYCYDDDPAICKTDGGLYDWNTAMNNSTVEGAQGICPNGWHVPKDEEWYVLENGLKDLDQDCDANRSGWGCDSTGLKLIIGGSSGFESIFAGYVGYANQNSRGWFADFWSSSEEGTSAWNRHLDSYDTRVLRNMYDKLFGLSIRCLKD